MGRLGKGSRFGVEVEMRTGGLWKREGEAVCSVLIHGERGGEA